MNNKIDVTESKEWKEARSFDVKIFNYFDINIEDEIYGLRITRGGKAVYAAEADSTGKQIPLQRITYDEIRDERLKLISLLEEKWALPCNRNIRSPKSMRLRKFKFNIKCLKRAYNQ